MNLSWRVKEQLKANWGDLADSGYAFALARYYDPEGSWECYIYAMNPENEDALEALVNDGQQFKCEQILFNDLCGYYNKHGEHPVLDIEFKPIHLTVLLKKMRTRYDPYGIEKSTC